MQEIRVYDTTELYGEKGRFRVMEFNNQAIQGALDLNRPKRVVFEYPRAIIHLMEYNNSFFADVFAIGHGIGTIPGYFAEKRFKVAEINAEVVELSRRSFGYTLDNVEIGDGRQILEHEPANRYDYIILDAFTAKGTPQHLTSDGFFRMTRSKLHPQGSIIMNLMGKGGHDPLIGAIHTTLSGEYAYIKTFALRSGGAAGMLNILMMGSSRPIRYQARYLAGFTEIHPAPGYVIGDTCE
ncbi:hypothetical protein GCM10010912_60190 [Paenibacillus albidus]|uniref:Spermidine synthase n=1 Tax=Paenibacillus albidus TaxID=2041023 RepID=A0A917D4J8_9BACL|nr:fused MFS/spermidine synthase [Paenibacillus albidus]GGG07505.1 hypothetical protein GCM10010912_60190 [Paenibacillus albidus]